VVASSSALKKASGIESVLDEIESSHDIPYEIFVVQGEPTTDIIDLGVKKAKDFHADMVLGVGGGSAIDASKAIAGLVTNGGLAQDYMEVIGKGSVISKPSLPIIAVPTCPGTGAEVTKNAVILSEKEKFKASIRSIYLIPKVAIIDPTLMVTVPPATTAVCGMDALTQLIEAYTSNKSQLITDALAILGIKKVTDSLLNCYENGHLVNAREDVALGALLSGICLANAGLGAVHGFASPIGGFQIPHGLICAILLVPTIEANIGTITALNPASTSLLKYAKLGEIVSKKSIADKEEAHDAFINYLRKLTTDLNLPTLAEFELTKSDLDTIVDKAVKSSSMRYNPVKLSKDTLFGILQQVT
jgi:alcohol dehydrogenase class IV